MSANADADTPESPKVIKHKRMLFGVKLQNEIYSPWKQYYIDYDLLKKLLKENIILSESWNDQDENKFVSQLDAELEKVYNFESEQYLKLDKKISELESQIEDYLEKKDDSSNFTLSEFQKSLENLLGFTQELDHFARLNFTGFLKIVKKHDRLHRQYSVKALLNVRLKNLPFHSEDYSPYLYRISILYQFLRENFESGSLSASLNNSVRKISNSGKLSNSMSSNTPLQNSIADNSFRVLKFWVHPDNLMEIKTTILRHLPVLVYNNKDDYDDDNTQDPTITSLYFDNNHFELYNMKLLKNLNKTPSVRIKWTGKLKENPELTVEKKFFNYDTGESNDTRVQLKEKYINDFINAHDDDDDLHALHSDDRSSTKKFTVNKYMKRLIRRNLPKDVLAKYEQDFKSLHEFIQQNDLEPVLRTVFTRTAFQIPGDDDNLRITIDSNILFIREDSFDKDRPIRNASTWHRLDLDDSNLKDTYSVLRKGEYAKFPYSVMEIKIKNSILSNKSSKTFKWVDELTNSHLVKEVPNFSKFIQGISSLFLEDDSLEILPFWLPELEHDIRRKPEEAYRESQLKDAKIAKETNNLRLLKSPRQGSSSSSTAGGKIVAGTTYLGKIEELIGDDADFDLEDHESSDDEEEINKSPAQQAQEQQQSLLETTTPSTITSVYDESDEETELPPGVTKPVQLLRQSGPLKIEPKVYLANERTYLRWNHVVTYMTILTIALLNSSNASNFSNALYNITLLYLALTIFITGWSYYIWHKRMSLIKQRSGKHLDAVFGPIVLGIGLAGILLVNFIVGWKKAQESRSSGNVLYAMEFQHGFNQWLVGKVDAFVDLF